MPVELVFLTEAIRPVCLDALARLVLTPSLRSWRPSLGALDMMVVVSYGGGYGNESGSRSAYQAGP